MKIICMDCKDAFDPDTQATRYGRAWKCNPCNCSYRKCRSDIEGWSKMGRETQKQHIVGNRRESARGVARKVQAVAGVTVTDHQDILKDLCNFSKCLRKAS